MQEKLEKTHFCDYLFGFSTLFLMRVIYFGHILRNWLIHSILDGSF